MSKKMKYVVLSSNLAAYIGDDGTVGLVSESVPVVLGPSEFEKLARERLAWMNEQPVDPAPTAVIQS